MFAIVKTGGKQYKVRPGETIDVEKLVADEGAQVQLADVLLAADGGNIAFGRPLIDGAVVTARVERQHKGPKLIVFKYKSKSRYRRRTGHRQPLTRLSIQAIDIPGWERATVPQREVTAPAQDTLSPAAETAPVATTITAEAAPPVETAAGEAVPPTTIVEAVPTATATGTAATDETMPTATGTAPTITAATAPDATGATPAEGLVSPETAASTPATYTASTAATPTEATTPPVEATDEAPLARGSAAPPHDVLPAGPATPLEVTGEDVSDPTLGGPTEEPRNDLPGGIGQ